MSDSRKAIEAARVEAIEKLKAVVADRDRLAAEVARMPALVAEVEFLRGKVAALDARRGELRALVGELVEHIETINSGGRATRDILAKAKAAVGR